MTTQHDIETLRRHLPSLFLCCHSSMRGAVDSLANCYRLGDPLEVAGRGNPGYDAFVSIARALGIELSESSVQMSDQYRGLDWVKDRSTRSLRAWIPPVRFREGDMHVILPFYLKYHLQNLRKKDPTFPQPVIDNLYILHIWDQCFGSRSISASTQVYKDLLAWEPLGKKSYSRGLTLPYDKASSIIGTVTKLPDVCQLYLSFCQGNDCQTLTAEQSATNHPYSTQIRSRALASAPVGISYSGGVSFPRLIRMCSYEIDQVTVITRNLWTLYYLGLSKQIKNVDEIKRCLFCRLRGMSEDEICREMSFESRTAFDRWLITHCIDILSGSVADPLENWLKACEYFGIEPNAGFLENPELAKKMFVSTPKEAQSEEIISAVTEKSAKPPFVLPDGATWEDITIEIVGLDAAKILVGNRIFAASAFEMGFEDRRKKLPNLLWELLIDLAEANGNLGWTTQQRRKNWDTKDFQRLRNTLRAFFNLSDDPFQPYTSETGYQTRFKILYDHTANQ